MEALFQAIYSMKSVLLVLMGCGLAFALGYVRGRRASTGASLLGPPEDEAAELSSRSTILRDEYTRRRAQMFDTGRRQRSEGSRRGARARGRAESA